MRRSSTRLKTQTTAPSCDSYRATREKISTNYSGEQTNRLLTSSRRCWHLTLIVVSQLTKHLRILTWRDFTLRMMSQLATQSVISILISSCSVWRSPSTRNWSLKKSSSITAIKQRLITRGIRPNTHMVYCIRATLKSAFVPCISKTRQFSLSSMAAALEEQLQQLPLLHQQQLLERLLQSEFFIESRYLNWHSYLDWAAELTSWFKRLDALPFTFVCFQRRCSK